MSRTNRKLTKATRQHRRNKGPELFSIAADNELKEKADKLAAGLSKATIEHGSAAAASLLVNLAEVATYNDNPAAIERAFSIIDQWEKEPQVVALDTSPQIAPTPPQHQLTDGSTHDKPETIADAEAETPEPLDDPLETEPKAPANAAIQATSATSVKSPGSPSSQSDPEIIEGEYEMLSGSASQQPPLPHGPPLTR